MNHLKKILYLVLIVVFVVVAMGSCNKMESDSLVQGQNEQQVQERGYQTQRKGQLESKAMGSMYCGIELASIKPFVDDTHGIPNTSLYRFYAANPSADVTKIEVVFQIPSGGEVIRTMKKNGNGNFFHEQTLSEAGRYMVTYRIFKNSIASYQSINPIPNYVDNSMVNVRSNMLSLYWIFADGSSPTNNSTLRSVNVRGRTEQKSFKWLNGNQDGVGFGGYGWQEGTHKKGTSEEYALDYNLYPYAWTPGSSETLYPTIDRGSQLYSPLDGKVVQIQNNANAQFGKYVIVEQKIGDKTYQVYMGHLETISVRLNQRVIGGNTIIGTLGKTGADGYHLHMNAWDRTSGKISIKHFLVFKPK